jgi:hypothetical protein
MFLIFSINAVLLSNLNELLKFESVSYAPYTSSEYFEKEL